MADDDDADLLAAWRAGDRAAGSALVSRRSPEIIRFFRNKVACDSDVPDLVNQTFVHCVAGKDGFRGETSFRRYLYLLANNVLYAYIHRRSKREREALDFATVCIHELAPQSLSSIVTSQREAQALVAALREVSVEDQVVLELMYFEGWSGPQIAEALNIPEGTVRGRLRRGLARLRERVTTRLHDRDAATPTESDLSAWAEGLRAGMQAVDPPPDGGERR